MARSYGETIPGRGIHSMPRLRGRPDRAYEKPLLCFEGVYKYFRRDIPTLRDIHLRVYPGEFVFVTGPSGAGKSTLLQLIHRQHAVDGGRLLFLGRDLARLTPRSIPFLRRNMGIVFQDFKLVPYWTVYQNVAIALQIIGAPKRVARTQVEETLARVGLAARGPEPAHQLSGGEQQRVAIARAIVTKPALLLADEPTGNLDPALAIDILTLFEQINEGGTTVLFATHDHALLQTLPRRLVVIDDGRLIEASHGLRAWSARVHTVGA